MAVQADTEIEAVRLLLDVRKGDPLYGDRHLARAAELLRPHLDRDAYRGLCGSEAAEAEATSESQLALLRGEWARVKDLAAGVASLRRARAERHVEIDLGHQIYETPEIPIDPFSPGFGALFGRSAEMLAQRRDELVGALATLEKLDAPGREFYAARRAAFAALVLTLDEESQSARAAIDPDRVRLEALASLDKGDVESLMRMADTMLAKGTTGDADVAKSAGAQSRVRVGKPLPPFPDAVVAKARALGLAHEQREPNVEGVSYLRAIAWNPLFPGAEEGSAASRRITTVPPSFAAAPKAAQQLVDQFAIHPYVNSLGIRYLPPLETEWVLVEDFAEAATVPETSPLLDALALTGRRALSRMRIEQSLRERGPSVVEGLGLDVREYVLVCMPADVFVNVGARLGWGQQPYWTHFDGYQLLRDGKLRALVGGDARFGGLYDVCSIARDDAREGVVTRFAIVRRERMRTPGA